ncbi:hypothetical protein B0H10DRAFT_1804947 [Mycena sp. CBHHK59/15]|nr:hypothetical protein B0H10DRAFT_1804947 [Mycena sp. CBHHK59/15]
MFFTLLAPKLDALDVLECKQDHDVTTIRAALLWLCAQYLKAGAREMISLLFHEEIMSVSRSVVTEYFLIYEPELGKERRKNRLHWKHFWATGVNDLWAVDQHDKCKYRYGLALHSGIDPFIGRIHWMKIWWTHSNPRLILSNYLDTIEEAGFMPLVSQSDPGTENFGLANGHTLLHHLRNPSLKGILQHHWMQERQNVMPKIGWSQLRHRFTPGFEDILDIGVNNQWMVFIPWLQKELDSYCDRVNNTAKRADRKKDLPHGVPNDMYEHPGDYGVLDFKACHIFQPVITYLRMYQIKVDGEAIDDVRALYAPKDHEVFQLVPPDFQAIITQIYIESGQPPVTRESCWDVYLLLLGQFRALDTAHNIPQNIDVEWGYALTMARDDYAKDVELIPNLHPHRNRDNVIGPDRSYYVGGVNNGDGLGEVHLHSILHVFN